MPRTGRVENLDPARSKEVARERGANGGRKSGESKRERKRLSQIYADFLEKKFGAEFEGKTGAQMAEDFIAGLIYKKHPAAIAMLKELREGTEGSKVEHSGSIVIQATSQDEAL